MSYAARFVNPISGDLLELPLPNELGEAAVLLNGQVIERALFSDEDGGSVSLGNGLQFANGKDFADYLVALIQPKPAEGTPNE